MYMDDIEDIKKRDMISDIKSVLFDFECFLIISNQIKKILDGIKDNIKSIVIDENNNEIDIKVYPNHYAMNWDGKNPPLISFYCETLTFKSSETTLSINYQDFVIDLCELEIKSFEKVV